MVKTGLLVKVISFQLVIVNLANTPRNYIGLKISILKTKQQLIYEYSSYCVSGNVYRLF